MRLRGRVPWLVGIAFVAALLAGTITGTLLTIEDEAWPGRGGWEAVFQISALFTVYALPVAFAVGALLAATLSRWMEERAAGPLAFGLAGAVVGMATQLGIDLVIRERIDAMEDFLGGLVGGGAAGILWWHSITRRRSAA